jgi:hypothetical protein
MAEDSTQRWWLLPPRLLFHGVCAFLLVWLAWVYSRPTFDAFDAVAPAMLLAGCALVWSARFVASLVCRARLGRAWAMGPVGGVLAASLFFFGAPFQARFALAEDHLGDVAHSILAAPDPVAAAAQQGDLGRVGTYRIRGVQEAGGVVYFEFDRGVGSMGRNGMAYIPAATPMPPAAIFGQSLKHLHGPWYVWSENSVD